jgi:phosphonopyruvate decarboxylase
MMPDASNQRMDIVECLCVLREVRGDDVVVTTMGAAREWQKLGTHPLDFVLVPSSMGQATSLGLGIALARPDRKVIVCNGDGSMLMNLGSLVTITAQSPPNLTVLLFDNGAYEVTGAQPTPASPEFRHDRTTVEFASMARACGFRSIHEFDDVIKWRQQVRQVLHESGPTFVHLKTRPRPGAEPPGFPGPSPARARAFRSELASSRDPT